MADTTTTNSTVDLGDKKLNKYYQTNLVALPNKQISYTPISVEEQTVDSITEQVSKYLRNYYDENITSRQQQTVQDLAAADVDAASRGMTTSSYLDDLKARYRASEASDIASINNEYNSTLASTVQTQYNDYLARKLQADTSNATNQIEVDEWNANAKYALEELAYERALAAWKRNNSGGGGGSKTPTDDSGLLTITGVTNTTLSDGSVLQKTTYNDGSYSYQGLGVGIGQGNYGG